MGFIKKLNIKQIMKKLILLLFTTASFTSFSQNIDKDWNTNISTAIEKSQKTEKPLMLFFTGSDWCGWCKRLVKEVYKTPEFKNWAQDNVILLELDFNRSFQQKIKRSQQGKATLTQNENMIIELSQMFGVRGYPTIWFVNPVIGDNNQVQLQQLGSTGYVAGGPSKWIASANTYLNK